MIADSWLGATERRVPLLDGILQRIGQVGSAVDELKRNGRDTHGIEIALLDHELVEVERLAAGAREEAQHARRDQQAAAQLQRLRERAAQSDLSADAQLEDGLAQAERALRAGSCRRCEPLIRCAT